MSTRCERARAWISLELDGEISQLERALLETHLASCDACAQVAEGVRGFTDVIRSAPLERPPAPVELPTRSRRGRTVAVRLTLAATLAALAAGLGILAGSVGDGDAPPARPADADIALLPPPAPRDVPDLPRLAPQETVPGDAVPPRLGGV